MRVRNIFRKQIRLVFLNLYKLINKNGRFVFINFEDRSFNPYIEEFFKELSKFGDFNKFAASFSEFNQLCVKELEAAKFVKSNIISKKLEYTISDSSEWWTILSGTAFKGILNNLNNKEQEQFKELHLKKVDNMIKNGLKTYQINIMIGIFRKA